MLTAEQYAWARAFRHHPRWGPDAQAITQMEHKIEQMANEAPSRENNSAIATLNGKAKGMYYGVCATLSQTILDGKRVAPFQDEILREMGANVLMVIIGRGRLPPGVAHEVHLRAWRRLWDMPPQPPRWRRMLRRMLW